MSGWIERPSPNHGPRAAGTAIDVLLIHYTGMDSAEAALDRLCDPAAEVSCHWLIDMAGTVYRLVDEERRAWHAGQSFWAGVHDINSRSIGIELANPGHELGYPAFPPAQMAALAELSRGILARHAIPPHRVLGHSDVAPGRKQDPGEKFDWAWLAAQGVGLWPDFTDIPSPAPREREGEGREAGEIAERLRASPSSGSLRSPPSPAVQEKGLLAGSDSLLTRIGYENNDRASVVAFQRHWHPARVDGVLDTGTRSRIAQIIGALPLTEPVAAP